MCLLCDTARKSRQRLAGAPVQPLRPARPVPAPAAAQPAARPELKLVSNG